ncbi:hypothetical protein E4T42_08195 [Aureobasidium subglaciale]|nr:hypothetical protein E4T42_08195 [Aureobasidium subglaciale]
MVDDVDDMEMSHSHDIQAELDQVTGKMKEIQTLVETKRTNLMFQREQLANEADNLHRLQVEKEELIKIGQNLENERKTAIVAVFEAAKPYDSVNKR